MAEIADTEFGKVALELKYLTQDQLDEATSIHADYQSQGMKVRLRDILKDMDFLSEEQVGKIGDSLQLHHVQTGDRLFCQLALKRKVVTQAQVDEFKQKQVDAFKKTGKADRLGEMMMNDGAIDPIKFTDLLVEVTQLQDKGDEEVDAAVEAAAPAEDFKRFKTCPQCGSPMPLSARQCKVCVDRAAGIPDVKAAPAPSGPAPHVEVTSAPTPSGPPKTKRSKGEKAAEKAEPASPPTCRDIQFGGREAIKAAAAAEPSHKAEKPKGKDSRAGKAPPAKPVEPETGEISVRAMALEADDVEVRNYSLPVAKKKGPPVAAIAGILVVVVGGGIGAFVMFRPNGNDSGISNTSANTGAANHAATNGTEPVAAGSPDEMMAAASQETVPARRKELYDKVLVAKPGDPEAVLGRAEANAHLGQDQEALADLETLLKANAQNGDALLWRALLGLRADAPAAPVDADLAAAAKSSSKPAAGTAAGYRYFLKQDWKYAHGEFNTVLKTLPGFYPALVGRARANREMARFKEAGADIEAAFNLSEDSADAFFWRGHMRWQDGRAQHALGDFSRAAQAGLDVPRAHYLRALAALGCGSFATAATTLDRLVQQDGKNVDYLVARARAYQGQGEFKLAFADLDTVLALQPDHPDAHVHRSRILLAQDELAKAREEAEAAVKAKPDSWPALLARATVCAAQGELEPARADLEKVWNSASGEEDALFGLVQAHWTLGEEKEADRAADKLLQKNPRHVALLGARGLWYADHGRPEQARASSARLLELSPDDALGITIGGLADLLEGRRDEGLEALKRAMEKGPGLVVPVLARARAFVAAGQTGTALSTLGDLMKDYEKRPFGHNVRGLIDILEGKKDDAKRAFGLALEREPRFAAAHNNLGVLMLTAGDGAAAQKQFERAAAIDPLCAAAHLNRALALAAQAKDLRSALASYLRAIQINPICAAGLEAPQPGGLPPQLNYLFDALTAASDEGPANCLAGYVRLDSGRIRPALECFRAATARSTQDAFALNGLGLAEIADGSAEDALKSFARAIDLDRNQAEFYANRGSVQLKMQKPDLALPDFDQAIKLDERMIVAWALRGRLRLLRAEHAAAITDLSRAIALEPDRAVALADRGRAYAESGEFAKATVDLDVALQTVDPVRFSPAERARARLDRFSVLARSGNAVRAAGEWALLYLVQDDKIAETSPDLEAIQRLHKELSDDISRAESSRSDPKQKGLLYLQRAICSMLRNEFMPAISDLRKATEADTRNIEHHFTLGCAYLLQGEVDSALLEWHHLQRRQLQAPNDPNGYTSNPQGPYVKLGIEDGEAALYEFLNKLAKSGKGLAGATNFEEPAEAAARMQVAGTRYAQRVKDDRVRGDAIAMMNEAQKKAAINNKAAARSIYEEVVKRFPGTTFARQAQERIKELDK